jgi:hypothetical protein
MLLQPNTLASTAVVCESVGVGCGFMSYWTWMDFW